MKRSMGSSGRRMVSTASTTMSVSWSGQVGVQLGAQGGAGHAQQLLAILRLHRLLEAVQELEGCRPTQLKALHRTGALSGVSCTAWGSAVV